jgi:hypothetical protein
VKRETWKEHEPKKGEIALPKRIWTVDLLEQSKDGIFSYMHKTLRNMGIFFFKL